MSLQVYVFLCTIAVFLIYYSRRSRSRLGNLPLPPGPKSLPIIGNMLDMPSDFVWEAYHKWFKEFESDTTYVNVAGTQILIVNTYEAAVELFERRSGLYSSRLRSPMANNLMGWEFALSLLPYGEKWRSRRRLFHQIFNVNTNKLFEPQQLNATHQLLLRMLDRPGKEALMENFRHMTGSFILDIVYGIKVLPDNDPYVVIVDKAMRSLGEAMVPGKFWVDLFPWLVHVPKWFPGAGFQRKAEKWAGYTREMIEKPFEFAKQNMGRSTSLTSRLLEKLDDDPTVYYDEQVLQDVAAIAYVGGADTTASALGTFALAMLKYPDVQRRAQAELDAVLSGQLPTFDDQISLPYVTAVVYETLRWKAVAPFGVPHSLISDDIYRGYRLPAGSMIVANIWSMFYDEQMYPDPTIFNPDRFLKNGKLNPAVRDPRLVAFGFGRRICPGRYIAYFTVWITIASILATIDLKKVVDEDGNVIEPSAEYISGVVQTPKPFACSATPRSTSAEALIRNVAQSEE